jgi:sarcosine oxidase subunit gamma
MAERQSPLASLEHPAAAGGTVRLGRNAPAAILQVTAWPETKAAVEAALAETTGVPAPALGEAASGRDAAMLATGPGRYLVTFAAARSAAALHRALSTAGAAVTDLGHGRTILRLEGPAAASVLAKGVAIDLHPVVFPPGRVASTAIHHIDVVLHRREADVFDLWVLRGFAASLGEWLLDAGLEFGIGFDAL